MEKKTLKDLEHIPDSNELKNMYLIGYNHAVDEANRIIKELEDKIKALYYNASIGSL